MLHVAVTPCRCDVAHCVSKSQTTVKGSNPSLPVPPPSIPAIDVRGWRSHLADFLANNCRTAFSQNYRDQAIPTRRRLMRRNSCLDRWAGLAVPQTLCAAHAFQRVIVTPGNPPSAPRCTMGQFTTTPVEATNTKPFSAASRTASSDVNALGVAPAFQVTVIISQMGV